MPVFPTAFEDWTHRIKVTAPVVSEVIPYALIPMSQLGADYWLYGSRDDIRITEDDEETEVAEFVTIEDTGADDGGILVRVDSQLSLSVTADFWVYWGNIAAAERAVTDTHGRNNVFPSSIKQFYTLTDTSTPALADCTGNGHTLSVTGTPTAQQAGPFEGAQSYLFPGATSSRLTATHGLTAPPVTIEAFFKSTSVTTHQCIATLCNSVTNNHFAKLDYAGATGGDPIQFGLRGNSGTTSLASTSTGVSSGTWYYGAGTRSADGAGTTIVYKNAGSSGSNSTAITATSSYGMFAIGAFTGFTLQQPLAGNASMVVVSNVARSANYIATIYDMFTNVSWWTFGTVEENDSATLTLVVDFTSPESIVAAATASFFPVMGLSGTIVPPFIGSASAQVALRNSTGWCPFNGVSSVGVISWTNVGGAITSGVSAAECELSPEETTALLIVDTPELPEIPFGSTDFEVFIRVTKEMEAGSNRTLFDEAVQLVVSGSTVGANRASGDAWTAALEEHVYDEFGYSPAYSEISDLGVAISVYSDSTVDCIAYVDFVEILLIYTPPDPSALNLRKFLPFYN